MALHEEHGEGPLREAYWCLVDCWPEPVQPDEAGAWDSWTGPPPPRGAKELDRIAPAVVEEWGAPDLGVDRAAWARADLPRPVRPVVVPLDRLVRVVGDRELIDLLRWFHRAGGVRTVAPLAGHAFLGAEFVETLSRWLERSPLSGDSYLVMVLHDADGLITIARETTIRAVASVTS